MNENRVNSSILPNDLPNVATSYKRHNLISVFDHLIRIGEITLAHTRRAVSGN